jgi:hypothetical protein
MSEWQPIETYPLPPFDKDKWFMSGERVLIVKGGMTVSIGNYGYTERGKGRWRDAMGYTCSPTHWMRLPEPPL